MRITFPTLAAVVALTLTSVTGVAAAATPAKQTTSSPTLPSQPQTTAPTSGQATTGTAEQPAGSTTARIRTGGPSGYGWATWGMCSAYERYINDAIDHGNYEQASQAANDAIAAGCILYSDG